MELKRRHLILLPPSLLLAEAAGAKAGPSSHDLAFTVWRQGSRIGTHTVVFASEGGVTTVRSHAALSVKLGPITLFHYLYQVVETWQGGRLIGFNAVTDNNGQADRCTARRDDQGLLVTGSKAAPYHAPPGSLAGTHWNRAELAAPIINPENGVLMHFAVADQGLTPPPGGGAPAAHDTLTGFAQLDLWYDAADAWVGLRAVAKDHSVVEYRRA